MNNEIYRIEKETLTELADGIRILTDNSEDITTAQMGSSLIEINEEVASQTDLLVEAIDALEGKIGGNFSGVSVELCDVEIQVLSGFNQSMCYTNSNMVFNKNSICPLHGIIKVPKNTIIIFTVGTVNNSTGNKEVIDGTSTAYVVYGDCSFSLT